MSLLKIATTPLKRRHHRIRSRITGSANRPRLAVYRSLKHISAQLIDDAAGRTIVAASDGELTREQKTENRKQKTGPVPEKNPRVRMAYQLGERLAKKALDKKITTVVFDRGGYRYHGRVKALAEGVRAGGLKF